MAMAQAEAAAAAPPPPPPAVLWNAPLAEAAAIVAQRNLSSLFLDDAAAHAIEQELQNLSHVRLDREQLTYLEPALFLFLPNLTNLYLQQNELTNLKALENAKELRFLTVAGNRIRALEGLQCLGHLIFLDASENFIEHINAEDELPKSLSFLNVTRNPCCQLQKGLHQMLESSLPNLKDLDWEELASVDPCAEDHSEELEFDEEESNGGTPTDKQTYLQDNTSDFASLVEGWERSHGSRETAEKSKFQEAWNSSSSDVAAFVTALREPQANSFFEKHFDSRPGTSTEVGKDVGTIGADTDEAYKHFLGLYVDDALQNRGSAVKSILVNTCQNLKQDCDEILLRSHLRVLEDEKALAKVREECQAPRSYGPPPQDKEGENDSDDDLTAQLIAQEPPHQRL